MHIIVNEKIIINKIQIESWLQKEWLKENQPKKLVTIYTPETPILDNLPICWYPVSHSGRNLYERKYIDNVRGKPCSFCGTPLNGRNTHIRVSFSPIKIREEVWCTRCYNMEPEDKAMVRKAGYGKMMKVKVLKDEILVLREKLSKVRKKKAIYKETYVIFKNRNYYARETLAYAKEVKKIEILFDDIDRKIKSIQNDIENVKRKIKGILKNKTYEIPTYVIDYDEIVPFRSEEDFDF